MRCEVWVSPADLAMQLTTGGVSGPSTGWKELQMQLEVQMMHMRARERTATRPPRRQVTQNMLCAAGCEQGWGRFSHGTTSRFNVVKIIMRVPTKRGTPPSSKEEKKKNQDTITMLTT